MALVENFIEQTALGVLFASALSISVVGLPQTAQAQNFGSAGGSWSANWGFSSASDRSLRLQEAQAIRNAEREAGPSTIVNTTNYYDSRSNYQEVTSESGALGPVDFQIGDEIGQNTNAIGAMNTGNTEIMIEGSNNIVDAVNSAQSDGCVEGSILTETLSLLSSLENGDGINVGPVQQQRGACN